MLSRGQLVVERNQHATAEENRIRRDQPFRLIGHDDRGTVPGFEFGILKRAGVATLADAREKTAVFGAVGASSAQAYLPLAMNKVFGTRFKVIQGYTGTGDGMLAMERGEVEGIVGHELSALRAARPNWLRDGLARIVIQVGFTKSADIPDARG